MLKCNIEVDVRFVYSIVRLIVVHIEKTVCKCVNQLADYSIDCELH